MIEVADDNAVSSTSADNFPYVQAQLTLLGVVMPAALQITEVQPGTRVSAGVGATGKTVGAVFVFKYSPGPHRFTEVRLSFVPHSLSHARPGPARSRKQAHPASDPRGQLLCALAASRASHSKRWCVCAWRVVVPARVCRGVCSSVPDAHSSACGRGMCFVVCSRASQMRKLMPGVAPPDRTSGDGCGYSVAMDGVTLAMGCPGHDLRGVDAGIVVVYLYDGAAWNQHHILSNDWSGPEDRCAAGKAAVGPCAGRCRSMEVVP
jgi:hypothetical protein